MARRRSTKKPAPLPAKEQPAGTNGLDLAFEQIGRLVEFFHKNERHYTSPNYSEAEARKDFIDKF